MLSAKLTHDQIKNKIREQLLVEIKKMIDFARGDLQVKQINHLQRYFIGCLIKTDTQQNLLFPFNDKFAEIMQLLDLDIALHKNLLELCCQLFVIFSEKKMDESTLLPKEFHSKLYLLIEQPNKIEFECNSISKAIRMQSNEFQQLWDNYTKAFLSNLTETSQETILSEENDTLQCSDNTDQFQEEVIDKKITRRF